MVLYGGSKWFCTGVENYIVWGLQRVLYGGSKWFCMRIANCFLMGIVNGWGDRALQGTQI